MSDHESMSKHLEEPIADVYEICRRLMPAIAETERVTADPSLERASRDQAEKTIANCDYVMAESQQALDALMPHILCPIECSGYARKAVLAYSAQCYLATRLKVALTSQLALPVNPA